MALCKDRPENEHLAGLHTHASMAPSIWLMGSDLPESPSSQSSVLARIPRTSRLPKRESEEKNLSPLDSLVRGAGRIDSVVS